MGASEREKGECQLTALIDKNDGITIGELYQFQCERSTKGGIKTFDLLADDLRGEHTTLMLMSAEGLSNEGLEGLTRSEQAHGLPPTSHPVRPGPRPRRDLGGQSLPR
ncbi:hypothetical protein AAFF_G00038640 [Aldrovandia affinis]|uniref:Uncharacterized protein n=1 Tax=Aldrovandia affinis TaxID=143900 RepID=A0AAD7T588_9TELE|nr:hypothetical protein AAFF_G00038640 [Aldrovandia affinis]